MKERLGIGEGRSAREVMYNVKIYIRGWLNYYKIADMKSIIWKIGTAGLGDE